MAKYTSAADFEDAYSTLFSTFKTGKTKSIAWRKWQLKQCWWMVTENEAEIVRALNDDLNRHDIESHMTEIKGVKSDILETLQNVEKWAADAIPDAGFLFGTLGKARLRKEPLGVALIIGAWNFPISLSLQPLFAAIAAGCCAMAKPSELASASQTLLAKLIPKYLDQSAVRIVTGGPAEMANILEHKFNLIFFTGSSKIARFVTAAAAKHLTPTVLELGGQGPAIVTSNAKVDLAAKRIAAAKFMNGGQICLSVNHVFVDPKIYDEFVSRVTYWADTYAKSGQMVTIINERNFDRLAGLLQKTQGKIVAGGTMDRAKLFISPTVVTGVTLDDALMSEELFGPILPIIKADHVEAVKDISSMEHPLAIYPFSSDQKEVDTILGGTNSGGVTVNDTFLHAGVPNMPFGGVGESGTGSYHGIYGFNAFTHQRSVVAPPTWLEALMSFRYPPFKLSDMSKHAVTNKLGFKKGETIADQKVGEGKTLGQVKNGALVLVATLFAAATVKSLTSHETIFEVVKGMVKSVRR